MVLYTILGTLAFGFIGLCLDIALNGGGTFSIVFAIAAAAGCIVDAIEKNRK